jgi:hypothetical protein
MSVDGGYTSIAAAAAGVMSSTAAVVPAFHATSLATVAAVGIGAGAASIAGIAAYHAIPDIGPGLEVEMKKQLQSMQRRMRNAQTMEEFHMIEVLHIQVQIDTFRQALDQIYQTDYLDSELKQSLLKASGRFAQLLQDTLVLAPKVRKLCVSKKLGATLIKQLIDGKATDISYLEKTLAKIAERLFCTSSKEYAASIEQEMSAIRQRTRELAAEMEEIHEDMASFASRLKKQARECFSEADGKLRGCTNKWGVGLAESVSWSLVVIGTIATICAVMAGAPIAVPVCIGVVSLSFGAMAQDRTLRNRRKFKESKQEKEAAERGLTLAEESSMRVTNLQRQLASATQLMGPEKLQMLQSVVQHMLLDIGVDTEELEFEFDSRGLIWGEGRDQLLRDVDAYIVKITELLLKVGEMETSTLKVAETIRGHSPGQPSLLDSMQDIDCFPSLLVNNAFPSEMLSKNV